MVDNSSPLAYARSVHQWSQSSIWRETARNVLTGVLHGRYGVLLDVGCNRGRLQRLLKETAPYYQYEGADTNVEAVKTALVPVRWYEGRRLPFREKQFDAVVCLHVLAHAEDDQEVLHEIRRVLRPKARVGLLVPRLLHEMLMWPSNPFTGYRGDRTVRRLYSEWEMRRKCRLAGLRVESVRFVGRGAYGTRWARQWIEVLATR